MNPNDLRAGFLDFFSNKGHTICPSDRLVPENDPSLLFTPAGMNQFKDMFIGAGNRPYTRAASSQKCLRMPDLDNVGKTASHHTFFEMLGNFSFGDYFKEDAIAWAIEYLVKVLGIDFKDLFVSVYEDDDEAAHIWQSRMGIPKEKLYRYGEKSNFWPAEAPSKGPNGVCGPCSEIYVDLGGGCGKAECHPDCDCGRFVEIWNLVFTQFYRKNGGVLEPLPKKNIDTGMGFERLLRVLEGVSNNFETSLFKPIMNTVSSLSNREYGANPEDDIRIKRITDHVRAVVFCVAEGVVPSNEKQGYVVRKTLRRAVQDGHKLGIEGAFFHKLVKPVLQTLGEPYPEIVEQRKRIEKEILREEDKFAETFLQGSARLDLFVREMKKSGNATLSGQQAFLLYDTFGFPLDLTVRIVEENGFRVDVEGFEAEMDAQRTRARAGSNIASDIFDTGPLSRVKGRIPVTEFIGYETTRNDECVIQAILTEEGLVDSASEKTRATLVFDKTPFYAEAGGQVGDRGRIHSDSFEFLVDANTIREGDFTLHPGVIKRGSLSKGSRAVAEVDEERRRGIQCNHSATHLLHHALKQVLGDHVEQAGSFVEDSRLRFDFHHAAAMERDEIEEVQARVNGMIRSNLPVRTDIMSLEKAKKMGAMALFGEKYGSTVSVVSIGMNELEKPSIELCGGTHVNRTGEIGGFRIMGEESVAAGIRRIEAATSLALEKIVNEKFSLLGQIAKQLKTTPDQLPRSIRDLQSEAKNLRRELARFREEKALEGVQSIIDSGSRVGENMMFYRGRLDGLGPAELKTLVDKIRSLSGTPCGVLLISKDGDRANIVVAVDKVLLEQGVKPASEICRELGRKMGGGGGGRPGMAQGQAPAPENLDEMLEMAYNEIVQSRSS